MGTFFAYAIPGYLFILGMRWKESKVVTLLYLFYFWILMGLNTFTPDYDNYQLAFYNSSTYPGIEWGYRIICSLIYKAGFDYQQFRMIFAAVYAILTIFTAKRLSKNVNYVLAMFLLWPCVPFVSGLRNAMAAMIVCFGIPFLLKKGKKGVILYVLCVIIASSIHMVTLFYLVFIFARKRYSILHYLSIFLLVVIGIVLIRSSVLDYLVQKFFPNHKLTKWLSMTADTGVIHLNFVGFMSNVFFVVAFAALVSVFSLLLTGTSSRLNFIEINDVSNTAVRKRTMSSLFSILSGLFVRNKSRMTLMVKSSLSDTTVDKRIVLYRNISVLCLLTIPGYIITSEYQRLLFDILIVNYALFGEFIYSKIEIQRSTKLFLIGISIVLVILLGSLYIYSMTSHDVFATFKDNLLFQ